MLVPSVDLERPNQLEPVMATHGRDILRWLAMLDGNRTLEDVVREGGISPTLVDAVVGRLIDDRLVFRYRTRRSERKP
jgi:hypothetical protein